MVCVHARRDRGRRYAKLGGGRRLPGVDRGRPSPKRRDVTLPPVRRSRRLAHTLNGIGTYSPALVALQLLAGTGIGMTYAGLRLRTGSIWPPIFFHALADWLAFVMAGGIRAAETQVTPAGLLAFGAAGLASAGYGLWLLRGQHTGAGRFTAWTATRPAQTAPPLPAA